MKSLYDGKADRLCNMETVCEPTMEFENRGANVYMTSVVIMAAGGDAAEVLKRTYYVAAA